MARCFTKFRYNLYLNASLAFARQVPELVISAPSNLLYEIELL